MYGTSMIMKAPVNNNKCGSCQLNNYATIDSTPIDMNDDNNNLASHLSEVTMSVHDNAETP